MATLTLRNVKGSALTFQELDSNFLALDSDVTNLTTTLSSSYVTLDTVQTITGAKTFSNTFTASNGVILNGLTYPTVDGTGDQFLTTNGAGILSFATVTSYDSAKVQGQIDSDFGTRSIFDLSDVTSNVTVTGLDADRLDNVQGSGYLRSNVTDQYSNGTLTFNSGTTLTAAAGATVNFSNTTGTAPFTVASTTIVTNLNADTVDGFQGVAVYDRTGTLLN